MIGDGGGRPSPFVCWEVRVTGVREGELAQEEGEEDHCDADDRRGEEDHREEETMGCK